MVQQHDNSDSIITQDGNFDAVDQPGLSHPYSQNEIDDLLYGSDRPVEDRLARLREIRDEMTVRESGDFGEEDPRDMMAEIDRAIDTLQGDLEGVEAEGDLAPEAIMDPNDHLDALAPDDVDARSALTGEETFDGEGDDAKLTH
jgi:hypothetical protein